MLKQFAQSIQEKLNAFERFTVDVVYDRREGRAVDAYAAFLFVLSLLFGTIVKIRLLLYKNRLRYDHHLGCQVIVVGNLTVGGTGKTPVVEKFARTLRDRGRKVAILSRGYKSKKEGLLKKWWRQISHGEPEPPVTVSDGKTILVGPQQAGDEPFMLAKNLPGVVVVVDKDRVKAGNFAIQKHGADILILDDGFQYLRLKGTTNVLLIDRNNPFGNGNMLPRGILREPIHHIRRAKYVFLTKCDGGDISELRARVLRHKPGVDIVECAHTPQYLQRVGTSGRMELLELHGRKVGAFSGIAMPESFEALLRKYGAEIRYNQRFLDHHWFGEFELERLFNGAKAAGVDCVITTEKDAVRLAPDYEPPLPLYYLRLEISMLAGADDFEAAVDKLCPPKQRIKGTRGPFFEA